MKKGELTGYALWVVAAVVLAVAGGFFAKVMFTMVLVGWNVI